MTISDQKTHSKVNIMTESLPELIRPTEPEKTEEEYHELNMALASVLTTLKKHKNILVKNAQLENWGQRKIEITLVYKPSHEEWKVYHQANSDYYLEKKRRDDMAECRTCSHPGTRPP